MDHFNYQGQSLFAEDCAVTALAQRYGTPCYIYSRATLERHWQAFDSAFGDYPHKVCYAVKANSNIALLNVLARLGSGFDIVSVGELERVLAAGGDPAKVVFSGVGKQAHEIQRALELGIHCFNVESLPELERINAVAKHLNTQAPISLRVNPDVNPETHPYISTGLKENKFGISFKHALAAYQQAAALPHLNIIGIDCHIGSQLTQLQPFLDALDRVLALHQSLTDHGIIIKHLDIGGGLGVRYDQETPPDPSTYAKAIISKVQNTGLSIIMEPGRAIAANAGILVTNVEFIKENEDKHFAIVDAAMNDLLRPALYNAWQKIIPVEINKALPTQSYDIVGPVCETGDFLGKGRSLAIKAGDLLAVRSAGAYGFSMSSNYNSRNRPAEIMVDKDQHYLVRKRETIEHQLSGESLLP
ncbi:MAG TPA: diaminopimelate decarboxylase [Pseudomonadales bacterium]|nr:diaminopimelate decarboxylase [Pseudomonadales bacterium]